MAAFYYRALDAASQETSGIIEADTARAARNSLRERGLFPLSVDSVASNTRTQSGRTKLKETDLVLLTRQWATLLASGLTIEQALAALIEQAETEKQRQLLAGVRSEVLAGHSLRIALDRYPVAFPPLYRASVAAGEKSGELSKVMLQLADYLERRANLRGKTLQALIYPIIVAIVALAIVIGLMIFVVPQVVGVFVQTKQALPWATRILIMLSNFLKDWGWAVALGIAGLAGFAHWSLKEEAVRARWDAWLLRRPLIGRHLATIDATRFAATLSILAGSGVPLLSALEAGRQVITRLPMQYAVRDATNKVREGQSLSKALGATRAFPPLLIHMIANGEATGKLDELLDKAARLQQQQLETRTATLTALLEPLLLVTMGAVVMFIVLAVMQPIIEINTMVK